jgi:hypothetical protein
MTNLDQNLKNKSNIYWGDIHNHNEIGYGVGSLERSYKIARSMMLDIYAFTPHGHWPDAPNTDPKVTEYHRKGFESVVANWAYVREMADKNYISGEFVTIPAFEWHTSNYGDYCIYLPDTGEVAGFEEFSEMVEYVKKYNAVAIPHHIGYRPGIRGIDWNSFNEIMSPVVDAFSEHACSIETQTSWPMIQHSMGGLERSQSVYAQLNAGKFFGLTGSTDNHDGHPASKNEGLTGFYISELTKDAVFDALHQRHTFVTTGERIEPLLVLDNGIPGDEIVLSAERKFTYSTKAFGDIEFLQIIKNGQPVHTVVPERKDDYNDVFALAVTFGWGGMKSDNITDWHVKLSVKNGEIEKLSPGFSGGACDKRINKITNFSSAEIEFDSFTSRANRYPVHSLSFRCKGDESTELILEYSANIAGVNNNGKIVTTVSELKSEDKWSSVDGSFSSPVLKLGDLSPESMIDISGEWSDINMKKDDWYLLKVQQKNGHIAWTSPMKIV